MKKQKFEKFKQTGKIEDYLRYVKEKKKTVEFAQESDNIGINRRNNNKNN